MGSVSGGVHVKSVGLLWARGPLTLQCLGQWEGMPSSTASRLVQERDRRPSDVGNWEDRWK